MKRCMMITGLIVLACTAALAASADTYPDKGLEFQLGDNFQLDASENLGIAYRVRTSETSGWRLGASGGIDYYDMTQSHQGGDIDTENTTEIDGYNFRLVAQKLFYSPPTHGASFVWGAGPTVTYSTNESSEVDSPLKTERTNWSAGLAADMGVEWKMIDQLSIVAKYRWFLGYRSQESKSTSIGIDAEPRVSTNESTSFSLDDNQQVDLGVVFHF
jgi:opacity protein-like surface antigen